MQIGNYKSLTLLTFASEKTPESEHASWLTSNGRGHDSRDTIGMTPYAYAGDLVPVDSTEGNTGGCISRLLNRSGRLQYRDAADTETEHVSSE